MDYKELANLLLDALIDIEGVKGIAEFLLGYGYDEDDLLELGFDLEDLQ